MDNAIIFTNRDLANDEFKGCYVNKDEINLIIQSLITEKEFDNELIDDIDLEVPIFVERKEKIIKLIEKLKSLDENGNSVSNI